MKEINTNTSNSANSTPFLQNEEKKNSTTTNDYSLFDTDHNGIIDKKEQQAGIFDKINILLESDMQSCFGSDIAYEKGNQASKTNADNLTKERQAKAIQLAESPDYINKKILDKGSEVFHELKNPEIEVMGSTYIGGENVEFRTNYRANGSYYRLYSDDSARNYNEQGQWVQGVNADGEEYNVELKKNGNYSLEFIDRVENYSKEGNLISIKQNSDKKEYKFANQTYTKNLQKGYSLNTGKVNLASLKGDININGKIEPSKQGELADCYFLAQINALAGTDFGKTAIKNSITDNDDGSYTVSLKGADKSYKISKQEILYAKTLTQDGYNVYSKGDDDVLLLELAFEKYYLGTQGFADDNFIKESKNELIKTKNQSGEIFENRTTFSYGGFGGNFERANTNQDIAALLTGTNSFIGFKLDNKNPKSTEILLKEKAMHQNDVALTFSLGNFKKGYSEKNVPPKYQDIFSENHQFSIDSVTLDENNNIKTIKIVSSWDSEMITDVPYKEFMNDLISKTEDNNIWISSNNKETNTNIKNLSDDNAKEFAEKLKTKIHSGDIFKLFNDDYYTSRVKILNHYGGMSTVINDLLQATPKEWDRLSKSNRTHLSLEEYQDEVLDTFINNSGIFKDITEDEYQAIFENRDKGLRSYCLRHGLKY